MLRFTISSFALKFRFSRFAVPFNVSLFAIRIEYTIIFFSLSLFLLLLSYLPNLRILSLVPFKIAYLQSCPRLFFLYRFSLFAPKIFYSCECNIEKLFSDPLTQNGGIGFFFYFVAAMQLAMWFVLNSSRKPFSIANFWITEMSGRFHICDYHFHRHPCIIRCSYGASSLDDSQKYNFSHTENCSSMLAR